MADAEKTVDSKLKRDESEILSDALEHVFGQLTEYDSCPFCGWEAIAKDDKGASLKKHLRSAHPIALVKAHEQKTMAPLMKDEDAGRSLVESLQDQGLLEVNTIDKQNLLYVEPEIQQAVEAEGGSLRFCDPEKVGVWKARGAEIVPLPENTGPERQRSEDGTVRAREMVLVKFPAQARATLRAHNERKVVNQLQARREDIERNRGQLAKAAYDTAVRQGMDRNQAMNIANAVERGKTGHLNIR